MPDQDWKIKLYLCNIHALLGSTNSGQQSYSLVTLEVGATEVTLYKLNPLSSLLNIACAELVVIAPCTSCRHLSLWLYILTGFKDQSVHTDHVSYLIFKILLLLIRHSLSHISSISDQKMPHDQIFLQILMLLTMFSIRHIHRLGNSEKSNCT